MSESKRVGFWNHDPDGFHIEKSIMAACEKLGLTFDYFRNDPIPESDIGTFDIFITHGFEGIGPMCGSTHYSTKKMLANILRPGGRLLEVSRAPLLGVPEVFPRDGGQSVRFIPVPDAKAVGLYCSDNCVQVPWKEVLNALGNQDDVDTYVRCSRGRLRWLLHRDAFPTLNALFVLCQRFLVDALEDHNDELQDGEAKAALSALGLTDWGGLTRWTVGQTVQTGLASSRSRAAAWWTSCGILEEYGLIDQEIDLIENMWLDSDDMLILWRKIESIRGKLKCTNCPVDFDDVIAMATVLAKVFGSSESADSP